MVQLSELEAAYADWCRTHSLTTLPDTEIAPELFALLQSANVRAGQDAHGPLFHSITLKGPKLITAA